MFKLYPTFKRPNDVLVNGKKICGVLVEAKGQANGAIEKLVVGVGLNVNSSAKELVPNATSLVQETGRRQRRTDLLKALLAQFEHDLKGWHR